MKTSIQYHLSFLLSNTMELRFSEPEEKNVIRVTRIGRKFLNIYIYIREKEAAATHSGSDFQGIFPIVPGVFLGSFHVHQYKPTFQKQIGYLHGQAGS